MKLTDTDIGVGLIIIVLTILGALLTFLMIAGGVWVGLYILHAFGLFMTTVFTWKLALAAYILFVFVGLIFGR